MVNKKYISYKEAQIFVSKLGLKSSFDWMVYCKSGNKPEYIPNYPSGIYKNKGWISHQKWMGYRKSNKNKKKFKSYKNANIFASKLGLKNQNEWKAYCALGKKPYDIPSTPSLVYRKKGWISWAHFLGIDIKFKDLKKIIKNNNIKTKEEYYKFCLSFNDKTYKTL